MPSPTGIPASLNEDDWRWVLRALTECVQSNADSAPQRSKKYAEVLTNVRGWLPDRITEAG